MFCKHKWELLSETVTKSQFENTLELLSKYNREITSMEGQLCDANRKHIQTFTCDKCGKLKRFVEKI